MSLAGDTEAEVREQMASGFYECASLLGHDRCQQYMRRCGSFHLGNPHATPLNMKGVMLINMHL